MVHVSVGNIPTPVYIKTGGDLIMPATTRSFSKSASCTLHKSNIHCLPIITLSQLDQLTAHPTKATRIPPPRILHNGRSQQQQNYVHTVVMIM